MVKRFVFITLIALVAVFLGAAAYAQEKATDKKAAAVPAVPAAPAPAAQQAVPTGQAGMPAGVERPNFAVIFGSVDSIDSSDPAKPILKIKSDIDGSIHTIDVSPWTNITKVTDFSEIKTGDSVRLMTRKIEDREVAMTIVFGKIKNIYRPMQAGAQAGQPATPPNQAPVPAEKK